jgi:outer membrane protein
MTAIINYALFVIAVVMLIGTPVHAAEPARMGFVDMSRIMEASALARDAAAENERADNAARKRLEAEQQAIARMRQEFARDGAIMNDSERNARLKAIEERLQDYNKLAADLQDEINRLRVTLAEKTLGPVQKAIAEIAREEGVNAVFERTESALIYVDDDMNLTDRVIERMQRAAEKK